MYLYIHTNIKNIYALTSSLKPIDDRCHYLCPDSVPDIFARFLLENRRKLPCRTIELIFVLKKIKTKKKRNKKGSKIRKCALVKGRRSSRRNG